MQKIARPGVLVAQRDGARLERAQMRQSRAAQHSADRARRDPNATCNPRLSQPTPTQLGDCRRGVGGNRARTSSGPRGPIAQSCRTLELIAAKPFAYGGHAYSVSRRYHALRQLAFNDGVNHFESTDEGKSGILVNVHS